MTFNPSIPLATDSPSIFPTQSQTNYSRLQTVLGADHQFNLTAAANDGYHNLIHLTQQSPATTPIAVTGQLYSKVSAGQMELFFMDDTAVTAKNYQITPTMPIRAAVNFGITGAFNAGPGQSYNVTSVTRTGVGAYTVTWTTPMPDNFYIIQVTGMKATAGVVNACVFSNGVYATNMNSAAVNLRFTDATSGAVTDVLMGSVVVFSLT